MPRNITRPKRVLPSSRTVVLVCLLAAGPVVAACDGAGTAAPVGPFARTVSTSVKASVARPSMSAATPSTSTARPSASAAAPVAARDISPVPVIPSARVQALLGHLPLTRDRCSTRVRTPDVEAAWQALFGHRERTDLTVEELAGRVEAAAAAVPRFRSEHNFMRLPLADYETLEKDALGPRALPLARYESFAATLLAGSGARALYSVPRPTATPDPQLGLAQDIVWNETRPVQEKKAGDNKVVRATMLNSLRQLSVTPPDELTRSIIAFVGINAPDQAGSTTGPNALVLVDVVKGAADTDPVYAYVGHGPDGEVVAHEFAHLMSWRVCGGMLDAQGNWVDPLFTSLVPGFTFSAQAEATLLQVGVYRGWTSWEIPQSAPVAVARPYGARNPEEAQAVLNGELLMDSRFVGRLYTDAPGADLDAVKVQLAVWMARLAKSRPESYAYYRLTADLARLRATLRQRLEPFEVRAAELTGRVDTIYTSTNPAVLALRRGGMTRLKQAEDVATMALTGLPPYPASAFSQFRD